MASESYTLPSIKDYGFCYGPYFQTIFFNLFAVCYVINLDSDGDSIGQLDYSGTQLDDEYVAHDDEYVELNMHANEHPSIDEQSSSGSSEVCLAAVGSGDFGNIMHSP